MRILLVVVALLALAGFVAVAYVLPQMVVADSKAAAETLVAGAASAQSAVTANAEKSGNLQDAGNGVKLASQNHASHGELKWIVEPGGAVRGWNEKNAIEISFTPSLQAGKVAWKCRGFPAAAMPASCGR